MDNLTRCLMIVAAILLCVLLVGKSWGECTYPLCGQDIEGYWWSPDSPGEGLSIEIQSNQALLIYYHGNGYWTAAYLRLTGVADDQSGAEMRGLTYYFPPGLRPIPLSPIQARWSNCWRQLELSGALAGVFERYSIPEDL